MSKTHFKKLRNTNYLGSWDLADSNGNFKNKVVTISDVKKQMVHDGKGGQEECITVHYKECKPMIMNSANLNTMHKSLGTPYIEEWIGKKIEITVEKIEVLRVAKTSLESPPTAIGNVAMWHP